MFSTSDKQNPNQSCLARTRFPALWHRLRIFTLSCDWFIALYASVVIGQSNYFGVGFTTAKTSASKQLTFNFGESSLSSSSSLFRLPHLLPELPAPVKIQWKRSSRNSGLKLRNHAPLQNVPPICFNCPISPHSVNS